MKPQEVPRRAKSKWDFALFFLVSLALAFFLTALFFSGEKLVQYPSLDARASGVVKDHDQGHRSCQALVHFEVDRVGYSTVYSGCPPVGSEVEVRYRASEPAIASADGPRRAYFVYPLVVAFYAGFSLIFARALLQLRPDSLTFWRRASK